MAYNICVVELLIFITTFHITKQTDCSPQTLIWSDNAENIPLNWQFNDGGNAGITRGNHASCDAGTDQCYQMKFSIYPNMVGTTGYFVTNPGLFTTIPYTNITIKYAIKQIHEFVPPFENASCGTSYSVNDGSFTPIDMRPALWAQDDTWIQISQTLGTDAAFSDNIKIRWEMISNEEIAYLICAIDEIKLCG
eukprot:470571_1